MRDYGKQLLAENAYYRRRRPGGPADTCSTACQEPKNLAKQPSLLLDGKAVVITPRDAPDWLRPNQCFVVSDVPFEQLFGGQSFRIFASTAQLISSLRNNSFDFGASIRVAIHSRIVQPVLDLTLLFLGLPLVVTRSNRNVFMAIGLCLGVVTIFVLVVIGIEQLGSIELISPVLAAWLPLFIFVPAAVGVAEPMWER